MKDWDGTFEMVDPRDINFDRTKYQREENWPLIIQIASEPHWPAFVVVPCAKREYAGGTFWAYDAQQRLLGVLASNDPPKKVPVVWWSVKSRSEEAAIFLDVNVNRKSVSTLAKFKAQIGAENPTYLTIARIVEECGFNVNFEGDTVKAIAGISGLFSIYNAAGEDGLRVVLLAIADEWADEPMGTSAPILNMLADVVAEQASNGGLNPEKIRVGLSRTTPGAIKRRAKDIRYGTDCTSKVAMRRAFKALGKV